MHDLDQAQLTDRKKGEALKNLRFHKGNPEPVSAVL
jgi:hypothetical protein